MKKLGFTRRALALLLVLVMVAQVLPIGALAAYLAGEFYVESTGVVTNTLGDEGTINWPVKIYDYLNDGMLFEYSSCDTVEAAPRDDASGTTDYYGWYGLYAGGEPMPETLEGADFTGNYCINTANYPLCTITSALSNYTLTKMEAVHFVSPQYLRIERASGRTGNALCLTNFAYQNVYNATYNKTGRATSAFCISKADARYMAIVYKANDMADQTDTYLLMEHRSTVGSESYGYGSYYFTFDNSPNTWTVKIIDVAAALEAAGTTNGYLSALYLTMPSLESGDYLDISHVSYFSTREEAEHYGQMAVAFNNNPGECLQEDREVTVAAGTPVYYTYPTASEPTWNFSMKHNHGTTATSGTANLNRYGMNFTNGTGQTMDTYKSWSDSAVTFTKYSNGTAQGNFPSGQVSVSQGSNYVTLSSQNESSEIILGAINEDYVTTDDADGTLLVYFNSNGQSLSKAQYLVLIYRSTGYTEEDVFSLQVSSYSYSSATGVARYSQTGSSTAYVSDSSYCFQTATYTTSAGKVIEVPEGWNSLVVDLSKVYNGTYIKYLTMQLPTGSDKSLDFAYVGFFGDSTQATDFGEDATAYMNQGITIQTGVSGGATETLKAGRGWNYGNNLAFGMLFGNKGGGWGSDSYGGANTAVNGYYSYRIGYTHSNYDGASDANAVRIPFGTGSVLGESNSIYYAGVAVGDTSTLTLDGYELLTSVSKGLMTVGLLEGSLRNGVPVYREETVAYIAELLYNALPIPQFDAAGNYNYNFIKGSGSSQFATDLNGDGDTQDMVDTNGDNHPETNEAKPDLATALRHELGITFSFGSNRGTAAELGTYDETAQKELIGTFAACRDNIDTCMDAAYFLLNNLFVSNSYNQLQDDFTYLTLSHAKVDEETGKTAYVFDAGFAVGDGTHSVGDWISVGTEYNSTSAVIYNGYNKADGDGTISLDNQNVTNKDIWYYADNGPTTRFPFLPVVDAEGDYAGQTDSYYFLDDAINNMAGSVDTYAGRNYNYVMASNGEFVYYEEDELFFQFEGDDDVYLFLNGQLVLDIGGAHSITAVEFNVNDYVDWARGVLAAEEAEPGTHSAEILARAQALDLVDGETCDFDFYYMERHGYGANCRIVTNMQVTDPSLDIDKNAYQSGTAVENGGVVDFSTPVEYAFTLNNTGNTKLYNLTFEDSAIGVKLDAYAETAEKALVVTGNVTDAGGGTLDASDLTAKVTSYKPVAGGKYVKDTTTGEYVEPTNGITGTHDYVEIDVTFEDADALWRFLKMLDAEGLETGDGGEELTQQGAGLWVDATVTIRGIYYTMTETQQKAGVFNNTVDVTATTKVEAESAGNETLRSSASHRVYKGGAPYYYQWAGHPLYLSCEQLLEDAQADLASKGESSALYSYRDYLNTLTKDNIKNQLIRPCDKTSRRIYDDAITEIINNGYHYLINYETPGTYSFYMVIFDSSQASKYVSQMADGTYAFFRITIYVTDVEDSNVVLDYGLKTEDLSSTLFENDKLMGGSTESSAKLMGVLKNPTNVPTYLEQNEKLTATDYNRISFTFDADNAFATGNKLTYNDGELTIPTSQSAIDYENGSYKLGSGVVFKPTDFMDEENSLYMALTVHAAGFTPSEWGKSVDINNEVQMYKKVSILPATVVYYEDDFAGITYADEGSTTVGKFEQLTPGSGSLSQSVDQNTPYGQDSAYENATSYSGGSLTTIKITDATEVASFTFAGTGFELIGRTNANDSATIVVEVYSGDELIKRIPVITEFDHDANEGVETIYQVPIIRVKDLTKGTYTVKISGIPRRDWSKTPAEIVPSYLYVDGLRIYQPMGATNAAYSATENNAQFQELRDLVISGKVAVAELTDRLTANTGTVSWSEDLHGTYEGSMVASSGDYLITGPNNEVYMDGTVSNTAIVFYVQEDADAAAHGLQIAVRALNYATFYGAGSNTLSARIQYGVKDGEEYGWKSLAAITTGAEQYYTIPYTECPYVEGSGYQVVLRADQMDEKIPALVSYTTLKTVGLTLQNVAGNGEPTILKYENGVLLYPEYYLCGTVNGENIAYKFSDGQLSLTLDTDAVFTVRRDVRHYSTNETDSLTYGLDGTKSGTTLTLTKEKDGTITIPAGTYTVTVSQSVEDSLTLKYEAVAEVTGEENVDENNDHPLNLYTLRAQMLAVSSEDSGNTDVPEIEPVVKPNLTLEYPSLNFQDEVYYNVNYSVDDLTNVVEMGLITFNEALTDGTIDNALEVIPGFTANGDYYMSHTNGIPAKNMGDTLYFKVYAKLSDGTYAYSEVKGYSAVKFATGILEGDYPQKTKSLMVAMLNYGAAAQIQFNHNTDNLMNAGLTDEQKAYVEAYSDNMVSGVPTVDSVKAGEFVATATGYGEGYPSVAFGGAFAINYYFPVTGTPDGDVTLYYWRAADFDAEEVLTIENATGTVVMDATTSGTYHGSVTGIAAKEVDEIIYVAGVYEADGVRYCTGLIAYSLSAYCKGMSGSSDISANAKALAEQTAVYGYYAKQYFDQST